MKTYFSHIDADHWTAKNNADKMAHQVARDMNSILIDADKLTSYLADFYEKITAINNANKRCKPLHLEQWNANMPGIKLFLQISGVFSMSILEVKLTPYTNLPIH